MYNVQTVRVPTPPPAYTYNAPNSMTGGAPRTGGTQQTNTGQRGLAPTNSQPGGSGSICYKCRKTFKFNLTSLSRLFQLI